ncbi:SurA N-terminal domain-containing protein [Methylophilaceae bacterium]|nr:SurA N-terminal domain-containing protein [Methylophilaceae bacterium]
MLDKIRNNTQSKFAKIVLVIIIIPFALFGIDSYLSSIGDDVYAAKVNGESITIQSYQNALNRVKDQFLNQNTPPDPAIFETAEFRKSVLDGMIASKLVAQEAVRANFVISDNQLSQYILGMPGFQRNGKFDQEAYDNLAMRQNLTPKKLDELIRRDLAKQQVKDSMNKYAFVTKEKIQKLVNLAYQKRDISMLELRLDDYLKKVNVTDEEIKEYYEANPNNFIMPDQVKVNFLLYSVAEILPKVKITDDEVQQYFEENKAQFEGSQQRRAKHILFLTDSGMTEEVVVDVKRLAESVREEVIKSPKKFDELAKEYSKDTESAKKGGDLGFFSRGMMVKEFDETVFDMKVGDVSPLVKTQFGFHIIALTEIKGDEVTFDSVKAQIKGEILYSKAQQIYAEGAEEFANLIYEKSGSLQPAADRFDLTIQESQWLSLDTATKFFNNEAFAQAVFDTEAIEQKTNINAIEVSPNNLISAQVIDFKPSAPRTLDDAKEEIKEFLTKSNAQKLLISDGEEMIEKLESNSKKAEWIDELVIDKVDPQGISKPIVRAIFSMNQENLPSYEGIYDPANDEYIVVRLNDVISDEVTDNLSVDIYRDEYMAALKDAIDNAYVDDLRAMADIEYNPQVIQYRN